MLSMTSSPTRRWPSRSGEPFGLQSVLELGWRWRAEARLYLSLPPARQDLTQGQWPEGQFIFGVEGRGGRDSNPTGLCWPSAHSVQCEPEESCRRLTQTWVQAWKPDYSLNRTKGSSAIQCCQWHHRPPEGEQVEVGSHSASNLSLTLDTAPGFGSVAELNFGCCLLCLYSVGRYHTARPSEVFLYTGSSLIKYK